LSCDLENHILKKGAIAMGLHALLKEAFLGHISLIILPSSQHLPSQEIVYLARHRWLMSAILATQEA
jgi:hypothetical protein